MSSPGNRKVKDKAKSDDLATEKIETYGQPHNDKGGRIPINPCLKSKRVWLDKELVKIANQAPLTYKYFTMAEENFENNHSQIFQIRLLHLFQKYCDKKYECRQYRITVHFPVQIAIPV